MIEQKVRRIHGHEQQCGDFREGVRELNDNGKYTIKIPKSCATIQKIVYIFKTMGNSVGCTYPL